MECHATRICPARLSQSISQLESAVSFKEFGGLEPVKLLAAAIIVAIAGRNFQPSLRGGFRGLLTSRFHP